ncbi:hypothetical protein HOLleu_33087 [Holothuria leucospilota]|uniref:Uncharacterized protein n=1 Tax=Holothuria leucospilota TaxID=206669 RepID=A0A9Q0YN30_HOLLE|nr:hypothetical protein HOLleu_33087 [Holothuria leucospilota]
MENAVVDGTVLEGYSPATNFEVRLLETKSVEPPSTTRTLSVFEVFDEVLPQLGIFQKVLHLVRDELFESIFSKQYTSTKEDESRTTSDDTPGKPKREKKEESFNIQRIPYFKLIKDILDQRFEEAEHLNDEIRELKRVISEKNSHCQEIQTANSHLHTQKEDLEKIIISKDESIEAKEEEITKLEEELQILRDTSALEKRRLEFEKRKLQERINSLEKENEFLDQFKQGYDSLHEAFIFRPGEDKFILGQRRSRKPVLASKKNHLLTNIQAAKKLEQQLLQVQNQCMEEFDSFLENHKGVLQRMVMTDSFKDEYGVVLEGDNTEMRSIDMELNTAQDRFKHTIEALQGELDMIRQHHHYLQNQLEAVTKPKEPKPPSRVGLRPPGKDPTDRSSSVDNFGKQSRLSGKDSVLSSADNFENVDLLSGEVDPFIPQEAILSKYSIMIYTSTNNKKTFYELKDAKFCPSCGEKTVVCPHKVSGEKIISLPHNCTHVKLSRPRIKIPADRKERGSYRPYPPSGRGRPMVPDIVEAGDSETKRMHSRISMPDGSARRMQEPFHKDSVTPGMGIRPETDPTPTQMTEKEKETTSESSQEHKQNSLYIMWDDFKLRTDISRSVPMPMEMQRCLSLIGQCYSHILWTDEHTHETQENKSVVDNFYTFMEERYILKDVMFLSMHDFITAIIEYSSVSKHIQLFCHVMVGNHDAATFRYVLLIGDLIDRVDWKFVEDFKVFASLLYPFLNEDEVDQLHLGYTSFSENKVSKALVYEYFMYIILKYREPRFQDVEVKLLQRPMKEFGLMNRSEFNESMDALSPLINEKLRDKLFSEAELHFSEGRKVSVARLTQIASYLLLSQDAPLLRQKIADDVEDSRVRPSSHKTGTSRGDSVTTQKVEDNEDILTMAKLRNLAKNISRRDQARSMRRIEGNLRYDINEGDDEMTFDVPLVES